MSEDFAHEPTNINLKKSVACRKLPANFNQDDLPLFADELEKYIPEPKILKYEDVKISAEGIIFYKNRILTESFAYASNFKEWKKRSVIKTYLQNLLFRKSSRRKNVLWVTDDWSGGYFHWLCDVLPKLVIASECIKTTSLLLPAKFKNVDFVSASLKILGVQNVEYINENETVLCEKIFLPTHTDASGNFNESVIKKVRQIFAEGMNSQTDNDYRRVYISRKKAGKRKILNEEDILDILKRYDFHVVSAEDYSFTEQIRLFGSINYLISIHGAGLTNMLFMPEGGSVMELRKNDKEVTNCYFNMASALDIKFYYQLCASDKPAEAPHTADLIVDEKKLIENLERFLKN